MIALDVRKGAFIEVGSMTTTCLNVKDAGKHLRKNMIIFMTEITITARSVGKKWSVRKI